MLALVALSYFGIRYRLHTTFIKTLAVPGMPLDGVQPSSTAPAANVTQRGRSSLNVKLPLSI